MHRKPFFPQRQRPKALERRMAHRPQWFSTFLAGNHREQNRLRREIATMKGSVVWLLRQRRQGQWSLDERTRLREVMRSASAVSPYLIIWAIPGSLLLLPFLAWFIDHRRQRNARTSDSAAPADSAAPSSTNASDTPLTPPA